MPYQVAPIADLITNPKITGIVSELMLNQPFAFHHVHAARHDPGTPTFPWHHDYEQYPQKDRHHRMVHVFFYLNGLNGEIGDLLAVPKTQHMVMDRYVHSAHAAQDIDGMVVFNDLPEGSVIALHSAILHARRAQPAPLYKTPRYFIDMSFCQVGTLWPAYRERGNWREMLALLRQSQIDSVKRWPELFSESHFYDFKS
jgi:ectoine hydroxylase-related dioxygenase (phytanoyl-CoA dioxygenase family)